MIQVQVVDGKGSGHAAEVSPYGTLVAGQGDPSNPVTILLVSATGAHNFCAPVTGKQYFISDIIVTTNKDIGVNGATVEIYEATSEDATAVAKPILTTVILKNSSLVLTGLHWKVTTGRWLNVKTDDDTVYATIASHLVPAHDENPAEVGVGADV